MVNNVQFYKPSVYKENNTDIQRLRDFAKQLMSQSQPTDTQIVSGVAVKKSPIEGLSNALKMGLGAYASDKADEMQKQSDTQRNELLRQAIQQKSLDPLMNGSTDMQMMALQQQMNDQANQKAFEQQKQLAQMRNMNDPASSGGAMGAMVHEYMNATGLPFDKALYAVQTGMRQGLSMGNDGSISPMPGVAESKGAIKAGESHGTEVGKGQGEAENRLQDLQSSLPELDNTVNKLSDLADKATYTTVGRGVDILSKELLGKSTEGATARSDYMATVDDVLLPQLRQTFGAQFTAKEGEQLRATLGDPNSTPEQKKAVLNAFIWQKQQTLESLGRRTGNGQDPMQEWQNASQNFENRNGVSPAQRPQQSNGIPKGWSVREK